MRDWRRSLPALLIALTLTLSGCSMTPEALKDRMEDVFSPLPTAEAAPYEAPVGDVAGSDIARVTLYYPSVDNTVLTPVARLFWLSGAESLLTRVAEELLQAPVGAENASAATGMRLKWMETSMGVVTVNLYCDIAPEEAQLAAVAAAFAATFTAMDGIEGVNVLLDGRAVRLGGLPVGTLRNADEQVSRWRQRLTEEAAHLETDHPERAITVFCPAADGASVVPEMRAIALDAADGAEAALRALQEKPQRDNLYACIPGVGDAMAKSPSIDEIGGQNILSVYYAPRVFDALEASPVERWQFLASQVLTLTAFCPEIDGVRVYFGDYLVTEAPDGAGNMASYPGGILRRSDFAARIGALVPVYFAGENGSLACEERVIGWADAGSPRALFALLAEGPGDERMRAVFPAGVTAADLIGVAARENILEINLSARFYGLCQALDAREEALAVYGLVNTLAANGLAKAVRFYIEGSVADTLAGTISLRGALMPRTGR